MTSHDSIFLLAVENGCLPIWHNGIFGWSWHCGCDDERHYYDQQCSMITLESARNSGLSQQKAHNQ